MAIPLARNGTTHKMRPSMLAVVVVLCASCGGGIAGPATTAPAIHDQSRSGTDATDQSGNGATARIGARSTDRLGVALPVPAALTPLSALASSTDGQWHPAGRLVGGVPAVYETTLVPPGGSQPAGVAWLDTHLLSARLYSGSSSPGGGPYRYSAPIKPAEAASLVAAFNGGFLMDTAGGGYFTDGRVVAPLVTGAASLVIRTDGTVSLGAWGTDVSMTTDVVSVRQNLLPLVAGGRPTPLAAAADWQAWGNTCGATSCAHSVPGVEQQWRSGVGVTAEGALVYVTGPALTPLQLADVLVAARAERGMELDINPSWTVLATYAPITPDGLAAPANGDRLVSASMQGPATFFESTWARDFITLSTRTMPAG